MKSLQYILYTCLLSLLFSMAVFAADGQLSFSDPTGKVGEEITVNMKVKSDTPLARVDITLRYDSNSLQFVSGTNTDGGAGTLRVHGTGDNSVANTLAFALKFKAASAGQSSITVEKQEIYSGDESLLNLTHVGKGAVNITAEETSSESTAETSASAEESEEAETKNEGVKLTAKDKSITIMNPGSDVKIPDGFWESTIDVDGHQVKGWVWKADTEHQYIIVYGMNDAGDLHFYRYDLKEKTIQRYFQDPLEAEQKKNAESYPTLLNQYDALVGKYNVQTILSIVFALVALLLAALSIFLWQTRSKLKKIIAFQRETLERERKESRPNVERFSLKEEFPMKDQDFPEEDEEEEEGRTKLIGRRPNVHHEGENSSDIEDADLGATRAISLSAEDKKRLADKEIHKKEDSLEHTKEVELEIEEL